MSRVSIVQNILAVNDRISNDIHQLLTEQQVFTINMMSSAGAGKTTLLEQTIKRLKGRLEIGVIEGDVETSADAERIEAVGAQAVQIITQGTCHLEAHMVQMALNELDLEPLDILFIENVGNLVCPAGWNLGEDLKIVVVSTTEGDDKPAKYPAMFAASTVMVINKIDLLPYVDYNLATVKNFALSVNPHLQIFELSSRTGEGLDTWCTWLQSMGRKGKRASSLEQQRVDFQAPIELRQ